MFTQTVPDRRSHHINTYTQNEMSDRENKALATCTRTHTHTYSFDANAFVHSAL